MTKTKKKRKKRRDSLVLKLLIIVAIVLVVFEGKLILTMVTHRSSMSQTATAEGTGAEALEDQTEKETEAGSSGAAVTTSSQSTYLAGLAPGVSGGSPVSFTPSTEAPRHDTVSDPDSPAIVREASSPVDDSYFSDAVFIGDSRMQGFRNASGITQGTFLTSVGMSLETMKSEAIIPTEGGENITVAAALSGARYGKVYIMLGANDLGEYDWDTFRQGFISCVSRFQELQPDAIFYICSCVYVEESKVTTGSYVNNTNVDTLNSILLEICQEQGYGYLDLNEILSDGYGSLIAGASSDGVHLYESYCQQMLAYLKTHYYTEDSQEQETESESETEASDNA